VLRFPLRRISLSQEPFSVGRAAPGVGRRRHLAQGAGEPGLGVGGRGLRVTHSGLDLFEPRSGVSGAPGGLSGLIRGGPRGRDRGMLTRLCHAASVALPDDGDKQFLQPPAGTIRRSVAEAAAPDVPRCAPRGIRGPE
jgi:hypothetical protein